ncbi:pyrimidine/purine nucleoside phosphorylase [Arcobacter roscoffensis]|uniref:Pyrimidine/purine nucleoside phosphorylase n=1 Tax=Arcobacter roscoffensis TaxID=2961520 RepID=A0ABY5E5D1_9BACT|nr:pyrimidine/purine nucleoside phosphorylase [Arcobacter roscoffensis]UTJ07366.1 pyrimidine/purine nucleoside phosphorylase [Arcobacter roscoffensis]
MAEFNNVSIAKAANILFEGNITSRSIEFEDGSKKTLGIMLPGEYELNTVHSEIMDIQRGKLEVMLPAEDWVEYEGPATFEIPANSKFKLKVHSLVDYCCSFVK